MKEKKVMTQAKELGHAVFKFKQHVKDLPNNINNKQAEDLRFEIASLMTSCDSMSASLGILAYEITPSLRNDPSIDIERFKKGSELAKALLDVTKKMRDFKKDIENE